MTKEFKLNIGEYAWFLYDNKVCEGQVESVSFILTNTQTWTHHTIKDLLGQTGHAPIFGEEILFKSKEELLASF